LRVELCKTEEAFEYLQGMLEIMQHTGVYENKGMKLEFNYEPSFPAALVVVQDYPPCEEQPRNDEEDDPMESSLRLLEALERAPELKRRLAVRVVRDILDSEAFMEAYPRVDGPAENANEELAKIIVRLFRKNRTSEEDAEAVLERAGIIYDGMYSREGESARGQANDKE
jgi:hypothetical protein